MECCPATAPVEAVTREDGTTCLSHAPRWRPGQLAESGYSSMCSRNPVVSTVSAMEMLMLPLDESISQPEAEQMQLIEAAQREDPELLTLFGYLEQGALASEETVARRTVLEAEHYEMIQGVLHFEPMAFPGHLCVVVPKCLRPKLQLMPVALLAFSQLRKCMTVFVVTTSGGACERTSIAFAAAAWCALPEKDRAGRFDHHW